MDNLDPAHKLAIISHMNEDHSDACLLYAKHFAKNRQAKSAEMIDVSFSQITLRVSGELVTVDFPRVAKSTGDIRSVCGDGQLGYERLTIICGVTAN